MIDYIGQLLEQQLEREERDETWETGPVRVPLPAVGEEEAGQSGENTEEAVLSSLEGRDGAGLALTAGGSGTVTGGDIRRWAAGSDVLGQAGERRQFGGDGRGHHRVGKAGNGHQCPRPAVAGQLVVEVQSCEQGREQDE